MKNKTEVATDNVDPVRKLLNAALTGFAAVAVLSFFALLAYFMKFGPELSDKSGTWGEFGDFFGGLINPVVGLVTVFLVLVSISIQRRELQLSLQELKESNQGLIIQNKTMALQRFEQTFFAWVATYRELLSSATAVRYLENYEQTRIELVGRDALGFLGNQYLCFEGFRNAFLERMPYDQYQNILNNNPLTEEGSEKAYDVILDTWEIVYKRNEPHIDSMFRTLYRLIKWIDEQDASLLDLKTKWQYVAIIRSQLSQMEIEYLFYNGLTDRGRNFVQYVNRYALFDNLNDEGDFGVNFVKNLQNGSYKDSAFSSKIARSNMGIEADE